MTTIVWICNTPLPEIKGMFGIRDSGEGWLEGISNHLRRRGDISFHYIFWQKKFRKIVNRTMDGITFWGLYDCHKNTYQIEKESICTLRLVIQKIAPDVVHIFGTELSHSLECINSVPDKRKVIVSLQGLVSELAKVYVNGIPPLGRVRGKVEGGRYRCLLSEQLEFYKRGINEKKILRNVEHVVGRTAWDRKCVKRINPDCHYHYCNETLRDVFYEGKWDIKQIRRYSILVSQAYYPIKGFHILIAALPLIKSRFPAVKVLVAGNRDFLMKGSPYGRFIKREMKKWKVEKDIEFVGYFTDKKMKESLLRSHVMVMPSLLENSPNSVGEAMLLGVPVVAADVGGISSLLSDGEGGYLYPDMDSRKLAGEVCRIFGNDRLALRISENGRRTSRKLYDRESNLERLLKIYNDVKVM